MDIVSFRQVTKKFGRHTVLNDVTFSVKENLLFGLVGPSGSGKTTILNILLGLVDADMGNVYFKGHKMRKGASHLLKHIGFCTQENSFYPRLSVNENLQYYGEMYGVPRSRLNHRIDELLDLVGLLPAKNRKAKDLSGGMKRRLDLAIALIHNPTLLILDEPMTGLDIVIQQKIWSLIKKVHKAGKTIIISSHKLISLEQHCNSIGVLHEGHFYNHKYIQHYKKMHKIKNLEELFLGLGGLK